MDQFCHNCTFWARLGWDKYHDVHISLAVGNCSNRVIIDALNRASYFGSLMTYGESSCDNHRFPLEQQESGL